MCKFYRIASNSLQATQIVHELFDCPSYIYNASLAQGSVPDDCQHGFRSQRSCETQLVQFVHNILDDAANRENNQTDIIVMNFAKAFDKVPHRKLLYKLDYYGIRGFNHKWITHGCLVFNTF